LALKLEIHPFSTAISAIYNGFSIFGLVFVSRDFEVGRNVSCDCEESTVCPVRG